MKTKIIPFDLEMAKKIQLGEVEGRIVQKNGLPATILAFDINGDNLAVRFMRKDGTEGVDEHQPNGKVIAEWCSDSEEFALVIEIPEETSEEQHPIEDSDLYQAGYKVRFEAGRCVAFNEKKGCAIKKEIPKHEFKVGDKIRINYPKERLSEMMFNGCYQGKVLTINQVTNYCVRASSNEVKEDCFTFDEIEPYEEKHEFKPFDKVLVRNVGELADAIDYTEATWTPAIFQFYCTEGGERDYKASGSWWDECIPYEGNEHLVGITDNPE